jgi:L-histidine Nalpha-methyltransferase / hercynylcysteine S-oxide synthase
MTLPSMLYGVAGSTEGQGIYRSKLEVLKNAAHSSKIDIIDVRRDTVEFNLKADILTSLRPSFGPKTLPTLLLYDEQGLQLFEEVSFMREGKAMQFSY